MCLRPTMNILRHLSYMWKGPHKHKHRRHVPACAGTKNEHGKLCASKNERARKDGIITKTLV